MESFNFNLWLFNFIENYWTLLLILIFLFLPIFPPAWFNYDENFYFQNNSGVVFKTQKRLKLTLLHVIIRLIVISVMTIADFLIYIITYFNFKETLSLVITIVVGLDIFYRRELSNEAVILIGISLLVLYFERLIDTGKSMKVLGKFFEWEKSDKSTTHAVAPPHVTQGDSTTTIPVDKINSNEEKPPKRRNKKT